MAGCGPGLTSSAGPRRWPRPTRMIAAGQDGRGPIERKWMTMDAYTGFAGVYDKFMDNIPYEQWESYVTGLLKDYGVNDGLVLELGCGTGNLTRLLSRRGYDMIAIDNSEEMLMIARDKAMDETMDILYLLQDMRSFELYGTVRAVVSICDSMNYITRPEELCQVFRLVNNYLDPGGVFIFDMNAIHKYKDLIGNRTIAENREDCSFIWDNYYYEDEQINEYELSIFVRDAWEDDQKAEADNEGEGEPFIRYRETHYQRGYSLEEVKALLLEAGMSFVAAYDAFTKAPVRDDSERMYIIARENGKRIEEIDL